MLHVHGMPKNMAAKKTIRKNTKKTASIGKPGNSSNKPIRKNTTTPKEKVPRIVDRVSVDDAGRVVIPAKMRSALGIEGGQNLTISMEGDMITLQTLQSVIRNAQVLARKKRKTKGSVVDELMAERRAEAAKE